MTRSRKSAIIPASRFVGCSAAGEQARTVSTRLVREAVVLEDRLFVAGRQLAIAADRRRVFDLPLVVADLEVPGSDGRVVQGYEHEPVPSRHAHPDGAKR